MGRRASALIATLGALAVSSVGLTPSAAADDAQSRQWYLKPMHAAEMWKVSTGKGVKIAVIDSGVNPGTPSLRGQVLVDEVPKTVAYQATKDIAGHGTSMAELIAGTGADGGLKGIAPGAKIVPYRVQGEEMSKAEMVKSPDAAQAIRAAADTDAKIISMSIGSPYIYPGEESAIKYAYSKGKLLFASTGNEGDEKNPVSYPAAFPYVVGVAASDEKGKVGTFSTHGGYVDLAAPGLHVPYWCDDTFRAYCDGQGTSMATAIASASAALIWSAHPDWTANQVLRALIDTAGRSWPKDKPSNYLGYGLIRPRLVLENPAFNPGPANADPLAAENGTEVAGSNATSSPSASTPSQPAGKTSKNTAGEAISTARSSADSTHTKTMLWASLGAGGVLLIGGGVFAAARKRRSN